jgi:hypothetical protein
MVGVSTVPAQMGGFHDRLVVAVATTMLETMIAMASIYVSGNHGGDDDNYCCGNDGL